MKKDPGLLLAKPNFKHKHNLQTHKDVFIHQDEECELCCLSYHQCRFLHSSASADVVTINHLAEKKYKEVTLTAHGHTGVSCLENNQKSDRKCSEIQNQWS